MIRAHIAAIEALLVGLTVYVTRAANVNNTPYVVLHPDQGLATASTMTFASDQRLWRFQTTCVGVDPYQAQWLAEKVELALLDVRPAVAGRISFPIRKDVSLTVERDEDLSNPLFTVRDVWSLQTIPA